MASALCSILRNGRNPTPTANQATAPSTTSTPAVTPISTLVSRPSVWSTSRSGVANTATAGAPVLRTVSAPYVAYLPEQHTFTPEYTRDAMTSLLDVRGPYADVLAALDMPPSFVLLDRVVWGLSSMLGRLHARNWWRGILEEYLHGTPPMTELGRAEDEWRRRRRVA